MQSSPTSSDVHYVFIKANLSDKQSNQSESYWEFLITTFL